jgi:hypothetical protein
MECGTSYQICSFNIAFPLFCHLQTTPSLGPQISKKIKNDRSAMLTQLACNSACQFLYHGVMGAICWPWNNGRPILSPPGREPMMKKVAKYGMWDELPDRHLQYCASIVPPPENNTLTSLTHKLGNKFK